MQVKIRGLIIQDIWIFSIKDAEEVKVASKSGKVDRALSIKVGVTDKATWFKGNECWQ